MTQRSGYLLVLLAAVLPTVVGCCSCRRSGYVAGAPVFPTPSTMIDGDPQPPRYVPGPGGPPATAAYPPQDYGGWVPPPYVRRQQPQCPAPVPVPAPAPAPGPVVQQQQGFYAPAPPMVPRPAVPAAPGGPGALPAVPAKPNVALAPPEPTPPPSAGNLVPPEPAPPASSGPPPSTPGGVPPAAPPSETRLYPPQPQDQAAPRAPAAPGPTPPTVQEQPGPAAVPQSPEPPMVKDLPGKKPVVPPAAVPPAAVPPASSGSKEGTPPLPVDIAHFAQARANVSSGLQPLPDGVTWLKNRGYRAVLHVRAPGEEDTAARRVFEQAGLTYLSLEVSPSTLSRELVDRFNKLVTDPKNQPLFVYDRNGALAGGLWYLHYRQHEKMSSEEARSAAGRLGFNDQDREHLDMWIAIQKILEQQKP